MFIGIPDPVIWLAYVLVVLGAIVCIIYGIVNWNKGGDVSSEELSEEKKWMEEEVEIEEEVSGGTK